MLRMNLSTHPFYNVRAVQAVLGLLAAVVVGVTAFNVVEGVRLSSVQSTLGAKAGAAEAEAARLRGEAAAIRAQINPNELNAVAGAAREANEIIDRRAFSWTTLFAQFEATLPPDVRIMSVQPQLDGDGVFTVTIAVQARSVEDLDEFLEALETQSTFRNVLARQEETNADGLIEAVVEGVYLADRAGAVTPAGGTR
jgi:Tfp pilus assembly protein PilN